MTPRISRRGVLALGAAGSLLGTPAIIRPARAQARTIYVNSYGGVWETAWRKAFFDPYTAQTGVQIKTVPGVSFAKLKAQVQTRNFEWDLVNLGDVEYGQAVLEGLLDKVDKAAAKTDQLPPHMVRDYGITSYSLGTNLVYRKDKFPNGGPQSWADFWDVKKFPGKRSYRKGVAGALEPALMADGVPADKVYEVLSQPGGVERAIKKIKELKPHVAVWWTSGAQHAQLMKDGEVDMITGWNGRFDVVAKDGGKVAYTYNQGLLDYDCFAIPKDAPNKAAAMKLLAEMSKPQYQAEFTKYITYGPTNRKAYELGTIDAAYAKKLPSSAENAAKQIPINLDWYIKNEARAAELYNNMLTE